ncbi:dnaJ homolog subfamily C member 13 [Hyalella azteca]|uniref:DnaJ homolog subfamily C member 13 n=1 Tax=Hyalella azteca TaxID=294128 RepID=A0A8B7PND3_HYAAZ|nr:dnaJ homolog subfamily C member 13 [Hyalella azteca]
MAQDNRNSGYEELEAVVGALVGVLGAQRGLLEYLPAMGHLPRLVELLRASPSSAAIRAALLTLHQTTFSQVCCAELQTTPVLSAVMSALQTRPDLIAVSVETLHNLFLHTLQPAALHQQALQVGLVQSLLQLLQSSSLPVTNLAATKAQIVACIKTLSASPLYGTQVTSLPLQRRTSCTGRTYFILVFSTTAEATIAKKNSRSIPDSAKCTATNGNSQTALSFALDSIVSTSPSDVPL